MYIPKLSAFLPLEKLNVEIGKCRKFHADIKRRAERKKGKLPKYKIQEKRALQNEFCYTVGKRKTLVMA